MKKKKRGQSIIEISLVMPFLLFIIMLLAEFSIYFFRSNRVEEISQLASRLAARNSSYTTIQNTVNNRISDLNPVVTVYDVNENSIQSWNTDDQIEIRLVATFPVVTPVKLLNIFSSENPIFPNDWTIRTNKVVLVE